MFVKSFVLLLLVNIAMTEIPSYIHICGRRNPKLDECITNSVEEIRNKLMTGIPELEVPELSHLILKNVTLTNEPNFQIKADQVDIYGAEKFQTISLKLDLEKQQIDTTVLYKRLNVEADYNINTKIVIPIVGTGKMKANTNNVTAKVVLRYKLIERDGNKYMYFFSMTTKLDIEDIAVNIQSANDNNKALAEIVNNVFGANRNDMIKIILPSLEKSISENILKISNDIVKHFHYDELLPDRE